MSYKGRPVPVMPQWGIGKEVIKYAIEELELAEEIAYYTGRATDEIIAQARRWAANSVHDSLTHLDSMKDRAEFELLDIISPPRSE
jgi:hypothetical protein